MMIIDTCLMNMLICHKLYGCIWENAQKRCRVTLEETSHAVFSIYLGSCAKSAAPGSCYAMECQQLQVRVRFVGPAYF